MYGVFAILVVSIGSYFAWRAWARSREMKAMREEARRTMAKLAEASRRNLEMQEAIHARLKDIHSAVVKHACGRETTWQD